MQTFLLVFLSIWVVFGIVRAAGMIFRPDRFIAARARRAELKAKRNQQGSDAGSSPEPVSPRMVKVTRIQGVIRLAVWVLLGAMLGLQAGFVSETPRVDASDNHGTAEEVVRISEESFKRDNMIGLAVAAVWPEGEVVACFGRDSLWWGEPVSRETLFEIGSITKTFTGILLSTMAESREVELDQTIGSLLPAEWEAPEEVRAVSLRQLTTHAAGFPRMPGNLLRRGGW